MIVKALFLPDSLDLFKLTTTLWTLVRIRQVPSIFNAEAFEEVTALAEIAKN